MVGRPSRRAGSIREAHLEGQEWSGGPPRRDGSDWESTRMAGCGREALQKDWEWPGGTRIVGRLSRIAGSGRQAYPYGWEWSGVHLERLGVVSTPSRRDGNGWEAVLKGTDRSEAHSEGC